MRHSLYANAMAVDSINGRLQNIAKALRTGTIATANMQLAKLLRAPVVAAYWQEQYGAEIPNVVSFIQNFGFMRNPKLTAMVRMDPQDLRSNKMVIGAEFFRNKLTHSVNDLLFIMMHERNHVILRFLFGSTDAIKTVMNDLSDKDAEGNPTGWSDLLNWMEDSYINGLSRRVVVSTLPERFYSHKDLSSAALTRRSDNFLLHLEQLVEMVRPVEPEPVLDEDEEESDEEREEFDEEKEFKKLLNANNEEYAKRLKRFIGHSYLTIDSVQDYLLTLAQHIVGLHRSLYDLSTRDPDYTDYMTSLHRFFMCLPKELTQRSLPVPIVMRGIPKAEPEKQPEDPVEPSEDNASGLIANHDLGYLRRMEVKVIEPGSGVSLLVEAMSGKERRMLGIGAEFLFDVASLDQLMGMTSDITASVPQQPQEYYDSMFPPQRFSRRDGFLLGAGIELTTYQHGVAEASSPTPYAYVRFYIDVSGSMEAAYSIIPWTCKQLRSVGYDAVQFSCGVKHAPPQPEHELFDKLIYQDDVIALVKVDPAEGVLWTAGGTVYDFVARDIIENDISCAVVLTDTTDVISDEYMDELRQRVQRDELNIYLINYSTIDFGAITEKDWYYRYKENSFYSLARKIIPLKHRAESPDDDAL